MKDEIILKVETKKKIKEKKKEYNKFLFRLIEEDNQLILYVNKLFYSENKEIQKQIIETILASTFINNTENNLLSKYDLKNQEIIKNYLFLYFLTANTQQSKIFSKVIHELGIKDKLIELFISDGLSIEKFLRLIVKTPGITEEQKSLLIEYYQSIQKLTLIRTEIKNENLKGISVVDKVKGDIFQLLCAKLIFNKDDKYYYNISSGVPGNLYPDLIYKIKDDFNSIFICDAKCYSEDEKIKPHKEFLYNILTNNVDTEKNVIGILFTYEKENSEREYKIKKIHKFAGHYFYLISLNIELLLQNLIVSHKKSYANEIANFILKYHSEVKLSFEKNESIKIENEEIKLVSYKYNEEVERFINS